MEEMTRILLIMLGVLAASMLLRRYQIRRAARNIKKNHDNMAVEGFEYAPASPESFPWLDLAYYDSVKQWWMGKTGFRWIGDVENVTVSRMFPKSRTFIREFLNDDGTIAAGCYHVVVGGWMGFILKLMAPKFVNQKVCEFSTEFTDGSILTTSNAATIGHLTEIPGIFRQLMAADTFPDEVLKLHVATLQRLIEEKQIQPVVMLNADDIHAASNREQALKSRFRRKNKQLVAIETRKLAQQSGMADTTEPVLKEIEKMNEDDKSTYTIRNNSGRE
ncbi:MAG: hypothetical protein ABFD69_05805 [Candidatus Sumerlaeia bacterium]